MKNAKLLLVILTLIIGLSLSCKFLKDKVSRTAAEAPKIDFITPAKSIDVKVELDKKQTSTESIGKSGGSVSLTAADGSKFTLEIPANALESEIPITMTAVRSIDGAPLESNTPTAVQLEPSGLVFNELATLTIVPAREIPLKNQIVFGYEGDGKDYHLAPVDPKSKEIKIKLFEFSGAGVASGSEATWAKHLLIEADGARNRLVHKLNIESRVERIKELGYDDGEKMTGEELFKPFIDGFIEQVVMKEIAAADLDCKNALKAVQDLIFIERFQQMLGFVDSAHPTPLYTREQPRLLEKARKCTKSYRVSGASNNVSFTGEICNINKPFSIDATFPGGTAKTTFFPDGEGEGQTTVYDGGGSCKHSGGGDYTVILTNDGSGTLTWTTTDTIACPGVNQSRTATFTLPLQPASDLKCP